MSENFWIALVTQTLVIVGALLIAYINIITRLIRVETKVEMMGCTQTKPEVGT